MMEKRQPKPAKTASPVLHPRGLVNAGANCWLNALMQAMLSIVKLTDLIDQYREVLEASNPMAAAFIALVNAHRGETGTGIPTIGVLHMDVLKELNAAMTARSLPPLSASRQECTDEARVRFIEMFNFDPIERIFYNVYTPSYICSVCNAQIDNAHIRSTHIAMSPPIPVPTTDSARKEAYKKFMQQMYTDVSEVDRFSCDKCGKITATEKGNDPNKKQALRISQLYAVHEVITITFPQWYTKQTNWFPQKFRLARYVENSNKTGTNRDGWHYYTLRAAMHHNGTMDSGHHTATCMRLDPETGKEAYYTFNDTSVTKLAQDQIRPSPNIHTLLYEITYSGPDPAIA